MSDYRRHLAWKAGNKAALAEKPLTACNRQPGTIYFDDWHDGHEAGRYTLASRAIPSRAHGKDIDGRGG